MTLTREEEKAFFLLMGISGRGVNPGDEESLKRAFRSKAKRAHPDLAARLGKDPQLMQKHFMELNDAFNILMERLQREPPSYTVCRGSRSKSETPRAPFKEKRASSRAPWGTQKEENRGERDTGGQKKKTSDQGDFYFSGRTPNRNLRFAEYLYYSGVISWMDLVNALVWQYRNRPKIGEMATQEGLLSFEDVLEIIREKKQGELFGEAALRIGYLKRVQLNSLVRKQKKLGIPIGHYFISSRKMSKETLYKKLSEYRRHNTIFDAK
jgi:curved DNA-binding protein CbpA